VRDVIAVQMTGPRTHGERHRRAKKQQWLWGMDVGLVCGRRRVCVVFRPCRAPSGSGRSRPPIAPGGSRGIPDPEKSRQAPKGRPVRVRGGRPVAPLRGLKGDCGGGNPGASAPGYRLPPASRAVRQRLRTCACGVEAGPCAVRLRKEPSAYSPRRKPGDSGPREEPPSPEGAADPGARGTACRPRSGAHGASWGGNPGASAPGYRLPPAPRAVRQRLRTGRCGDGQRVSGPSGHDQSASGPSRHGQRVSGPTRHGQSVSGPSRNASHKTDTPRPLPILH